MPNLQLRCSASFTSAALVASLRGHVIERAPDVKCLRFDFSTGIAGSDRRASSVRIGPFTRMPPYRAPCFRQHAHYQLLVQAAACTRHGGVARRFRAAEGTGSTSLLRTTAMTVEFPDRDRTASWNHYGGDEDECHRKRLLRPLRETLMSAGHAPSLGACPNEDLLRAMLLLGIPDEAISRAAQPTQ
jgi:hypothetical protein